MFIEGGRHVGNHTCNKLRGARHPPYVYWVCGCPCGGHPRFYFDVKNLDFNLESFEKPDSPDSVLHKSLFFKISGTIYIIIVVVVITIKKQLLA